MMINNRVFWFVGLMAGLLSVPVGAQPAADPGLTSGPHKLREQKIGKLGDPAPPLTIGEWVKGKPVKIAPGTNIYVLVFCTLSRANEFALTNLNNLQMQYRDKGVVVVAISAEAPDELKNFIQLRGADVNFTVAADDDARKATSDYQRAFGQMMLPRAYIVGKDATVLWMGHPLRDDMGLVVDEITSGRFNLAATQKRIIANQQMEQYLALARQDDPRTAKIGHIMLMLRTNDAPALCELASKIATDPYILQRDIAVATAALDRAEQLAPTNAASMAADRAILQVEQYLVTAKTNDAAGAVLGRNLLASRTNDATGLCDFAFRIATDRTIEDGKRDVALATAALNRAGQLSTTNATDIAVDRAILLFQTGKQAEGLAQARKALASAHSEADQSEAKTCVQAMETRLAADKASQTNNPVSTNVPTGKSSP